ncbi:autotransporter secretion outer membrane protein TamA [Paracandidimonas soli]|uniref:Autotransporter secretion outer membrane protein TamA n=2 Tax=Paracandidimonas soli TaxID=1917182 RepID=A0A4R3UX91_9BURK|nr:autotransporter secretion outer membrane protein TamA [Paracandidimonas soli]
MMKIWRSLSFACCLLGWSHGTLAAKPEVVIDPGGVPPEALQAIIGAVDAITRLAEDQDGGEVSRLRRRAHEATLSALETQGYFSAKVELEATEDELGEAWDIFITPGERATVSSVDIALNGRISSEEFADRAAAIKERWPLKPGDLFINSDWGSAKTALLDDVSRKDFYFARYTRTQATVDADEAKADLDLAVDSGPRVRMGPMHTEGLKRVPRTLIERYIRYQPGDPYDQDKLDDWQQSLQSTTFFRGAFVTLDSDPEKRTELPDGDVELPLNVSVSEAPARRFTTSLGVDSDNGVRVEGLYRQNIVFGQPIWTETGVGVDKDRQRAFFDVHLPPTSNGSKDSVGVLFNRSDVEGLDSTRYALGWKRRQERKGAGDSRVEYETQWGLTAAYDRIRIQGADNYNVPTLIGTWQWLRRDVDAKYDPREGNLIDFGIGLGVTMDKGETFQRTNLRLQQWWPIGRRHVLTLRGEVAKVWAGTDRVPQDFGYRTGGARTIRGYKYQSIGLSKGDATIGAPAMALVSAEYMHYFTDMLGMAVFVDAGDAAESFGDMSWALGYGVGARVRTPAGPFHVDVAYGQRDRKLRLHFSLGIAF